MKLDTFAPSLLTQAGLVWGAPLFTPVSFGLSANPLGFDCTLACDGEATLNRAMRYYFHVVTDKRFIRDPDGSEFIGLDEAEAEAAQGARDLMIEELKRGRPFPSSWRILIASEDDTVLKSMPFSVLANGTCGSRPSPVIQARSETKRQSSAETERIIGRARVHVEAQRARIAILESDRRDASLAKAVLSQLEKTFECMILAETIIKQVGQLKQ